MEYILFSSVVLVSFLIGYFSKGISITITHKEDKPLAPEEYNNTENLLDPEVRQYYNRVVKD